MTTHEIAEQLVSLCNEGKDAEVVDRFYADDIVSAEACAMDDKPREIQGIEGIRAKHEWWYSTFEPLESQTRGPFLHGDDQFAVHFSFTVKNRKTGDVMPMEEVAVYTVKDGKIVHEAFFYTMDA